MFLGTSSPRLDEKGRLVLPTKFRDELVDGLVVSRGHERCLYVWPVADFHLLAQKVADAPISHAGAREFARMLGSASEAQKPDKQGRVTIPARLRTYAGIDRECAVVGALSRVEVWDAAAWEGYQAEKEPDFSATSEEVLPGL